MDRRCCALAFLFIASFLSAQTWQAGTSDWNTAGNWTTANVPDTNVETATFSTTGNTTVDLSSDTTVNIINFGANSQAYTFQSAASKTLTIDVNAAANTNVFSTTASSGALIFNHNMAVLDSNAGGGVNTAQFALASGSSVTLNGTLSLAASENVSTTGVGTGSLFVNGSVDFGSVNSQVDLGGSSGTFIFFNPTSVTGSNGQIRSLSNTGALYLMNDFTNGRLNVGATGAGSPIGRMYLRTGGMTMSRDFTFNSGTGGVGAMTYGADMTNGGTATHSGTITISTGAGAGTYTNNLEATDANDVMDITGVITGTQVSGTTNLKKVGNGTVKLSGTAANTFASGAGTTTLEVAAGILALNKTAGLDAITNVTTTVDSGATLRWDASNQVNNSTAMVLNGGTLNFNGNSETMGTLAASANSFINFGSGTSAIVFADSSGTLTANSVSLSNYSIGSDTLRFGAAAGTVTVTRLVFADFGGFTGENIGNGFIIPDSTKTTITGNDILIFANVTGTNGVNQTGSGVMTVTGTNTASGDAVVSNGTLVIGTVAGGNWAGNVIVNGGILKGRGTVSGNLTVNSGGTYSPGNSPGIQTVGSLTLNSGSNTMIEIDGATPGYGSGFHDQIFVTGAAVINSGATLTPQTIFNGSSGYAPSAGQKFIVLTSGGLTGQFTTIDNSGNSLGLMFIPAYTSTEVDLYATYASIASSLPGLNANQRRIARVIDTFQPTQLDFSATASNSAKIYRGLAVLNDNGIKEALNELSPEKFVAMNSSMTSLALMNSLGTQNRLTQLRNGDRGVSLNGISLRTLEGDYEYESLALDQGAMLVQKKKDNLKNSFFINTTGSYAEVDSNENRMGFENRLGGITIGLDREITPHLTLGVSLGQGYSNAVLNGGGNLQTYSERFGIYGGYHQGGFYFNNTLSGGTNHFESKRKINFLGESASGETQGCDLSGQTQLGVDFQSRDWVWGPTGRINYGYQAIDRFQESGSVAALQVADQNSTQLETGLGMRVSRPFQYKGWKWIPEAHLLGSYEWYQPGKIQARFSAGGDAFSVAPEGAGQTMIIPGTGMNLFFDEQNSIHLNYEVRVNSSSLSHQLDLGWLLKF
ncbi:MAG: autotransporter domain-containing protein [Verrucomicrobiota bacterium]